MVSTFFHLSVHFARMVHDIFVWLGALFSWLAKRNSTLSPCTLLTLGWGASGFNQPDVRQMSGSPNAKLSDVFGEPREPWALFYLQLWTGELLHLVCNFLCTDAIPELLYLWSVVWPHPDSNGIPCIYLARGLQHTHHVIPTPLCRAKVLQATHDKTRSPSLLPPNHWIVKIGSTLVA